MIHFLIVINVYSTRGINLLARYQWNELPSTELPAQL